jgi:predicted ABC-type ATPase
VALLAGKNTLALIRQALDRGHSFTVETTLAGRTHFRLLREAKARGWQVGIAYVGIDNPETAFKRVEERYRAGGHNVPPADVHRRYHRSLANLPKALALADAAVIFDNSARRMRRVLELRSGEVLFESRLRPRWLQQALQPEH